MEKHALELMVELLLYYRKFLNISITSCSYHVLERYYQVSEC